ncbi:MAG: class I SAM-dependent methyltransferase [Anaerolineae bacterium]|nr:class I SAM-dependent methyltransferase [Anaerolineae bacterium]
MIASEARQILEQRLYPDLQERVFGRLQEQLCQRLAAMSSPLVLDAGSGSGSWLLAELRDIIGLLIGEDVYVPEGLELGAVPRGTLDAFVQGTCEQLPFADRSFDMVVSYLVLEHLSRPSVALREFARILKPGGTFCFKTPAVRTPLFALSRILPTSLHQRLKAEIGTEAEDVFPTFYRANTVRTLERELRKAGFQREWLCRVDQTYAYLSHTRATYAFGLLYSRLTEHPWLAWLRNQIIGIYRVPTVIQSSAEERT